MLEAAWLPELNGTLSKTRCPLIRPQSAVMENGKLSDSPVVFPAVGRTVLTSLKHPEMADLSIHTLDLPEGFVHGPYHLLSLCCPVAEKITPLRTPYAHLSLGHYCIKGFNSCDKWNKCILGPFLDIEHKTTVPSVS